MKIANITELPDVIKDVTTWENALLMLSKHCLDIQVAYKKTAPETEQKNFISIETKLDVSPDPYTTIKLSEVEIDIIDGIIRTVSFIEPDSFVPKSIYPWNSNNSFDCLVKMLFKTFEFDKSNVTNPDSQEILELGIEQNSDSNSSMFTISPVL
ncbi:hypothetical protein [Okeania sp.]|uniref:hypothetical protein n=1 Tax=Okeania sp. TaxID=3100323 RepID=UPI002B4B7118|nr:hypothetical protein [Okeania sp.]MEB3341422.1 hypothetical protein [Okeania sp.]